MNGQGSTNSLPGAAAREALKERCLALVRRWQPLAQSGWDRRAARQLGDELEQIALTSEGLRLDALNGSALELAAYLCSFTDDELVPNERDLIRLGEMVNVLGDTLRNLSGAGTAEVHSLHGDTAAAVRTTVLPATASAPVSGPLRLPRAICAFGETVRAAPGLGAALRERGYDTREFDDLDHLLDFLGHAIPGALLLDARLLRHMPRIRARLAESAADSDAPPPLLVFSRNTDLGDRLLAMRAGAAALFSAPLDSLRVIARLDELLAHTTQTPWRVLLAEADRENAGERARWLAERGMTVRLSGNGQASLVALADFRPDVVVVDQELPDVQGQELIQLIRQQSEYAAVPIVLMTASGGAVQRFDAIAAGADEVLLKPVKARHLTSTLVSRLKRAQWLREVIGVTSGRDPRSGLYSRTVLIEKLAAASGDRSAALLFIALDHAEELRERIGLSGLAALDSHIGQVLRGQLDELDLPAHYQDFRYLVLTHRRSRAEVTAVAERVLAALAETPWTFNGSAIALGASIGMALLGGEDADVDAVVTKTEAATLAAAHMGGRRALWFEAKEAALLPSDPLLAMRAVLSRPLTPEQAQFDFLPVVALAGKLNSQFELRLRVQSTRNPGASIAYQELAAAAAEAPQLAELDRWLLEHTLAVREEQLKRGRQLRLFVPQAVDSALAEELPWWLERELKDRRLSGTGLTLSLPCSPLIDKAEHGRARIARLREHGVRVCLADFGRDWAAVHALKNLEVDFVRLDPGLVQELGAIRSVADTVLALVRKAHAAGAAVIAPETDNINRAHMLLRLGVDYAVGPAFGRPLTQPEFDFNRPLW